MICNLACQPTTINANNFREVHEISVPRVLIDGDHVVIEWHAEWTLQDGTRVRVEELALQCWSGGRVVFERFFYDPGSIG